MKGKFPQILDHNEKGPAARELYEAATAMLDRIVEEQWLKPRAVIGLWPANAVGDDIRVWTDDSRKKELTTFRMLRQQQDKGGKRPNYSLTDFVAPEGVEDWVGGFAVTSGVKVHELSDRFKAEGNDYDSIMVQALGDRLAEAFAEYMHARVRRELWGYAPDEDLSAEALIEEKYAGIRPAAGYPACPDHTEKRTLFDLLSAEKNAGIELTESFAMWPGPSVSGLYFSHPKSTYFGIGRIGRDQVEDYARRKGMSVAEVEKWLAPSLAYEPKDEAAAEPEPEIESEPELRRSA
jgi:5-methyltetrahydrofolate--homocysteine methyltransferase